MNNKINIQSRKQCRAMINVGNGKWCCSLDDGHDGLHRCSLAWTNGESLW